MNVNPLERTQYITRKINKNESTRIQKKPSTFILLPAPGSTNHEIPKDPSPAPMGFRNSHAKSMNSSSAAEKKLFDRTFFMKAMPIEHEQTSSNLTIDP
jgi:hypothetical protein